MIKSIRIKNIALISHQEIEFFDGLNVLSGETGAGKTVIINAINFSLGAKGDKSLIRFGESFCETEIVFSLENNLRAIEVLKEFDIDFDDEVIIKRKLTIDGRSDVKINGSSVTLTMLKKLTLELIDVYGQSEHYSLLNSSTQLKVLDDFIGEDIVALKEQASPIISRIKELKKLLEENGGDEQSRLIRLDVLGYQINEIEKADLKEGEEDELLEKKKLFQNAQKIGESLSLVTGSVSSDGGIIDILSSVIQKVSQISSFSTEYENLYDRLYSVKAEIDDLSSVAEDLLSEIDFNEREKELIEDRLSLIRTIKKKYGNTIEEVLEFLSKCSIEYENLQNFEELSKRAEEEISTKNSELNKIYEKMFDLRCRKAKEFSYLVESELKTLGMSSAKFEINVTYNNKELTLLGNQDVEFLFSANKGEPLKNMSKIISGGEMSRFMLALKIVTSDPNCSYVFDEIDAGISGEIAKIIAQKFVTLSKKNQIITISHLPQIVSYGDNNYLIKKSSDNDTTTTSVTKLDFDGKVNEVVRLLTGADEEVAKLNAISAIKNADEYKMKA